jgi:hypothetical protein
MSAHAIPSPTTPRLAEPATARLANATARVAAAMLGRLGHALVVGGPAADGMICAGVTPLGVSVWYARRTTA